MLPNNAFDTPIPNLKFASWRRPNRPRTRYITVHYNGPPVKAYGYPNGELDQLRFDAKYHMRPDVLAADGIQYHCAVLSNGGRVGLRDVLDSLWHCGNAIGNTESIAIHIPIGGNQQPTIATLNGLMLLVEMFRAEWDIPACNLRKHKEWKNTACPGSPLGEWVDAYRRMKATSIFWFRTTTNANVRAAADVGSARRYTLPGNTAVPAARTVNGKPFGGRSDYIELADASGYIHSSIVRKV